METSEESTNMEIQKENSIQPTTPEETQLEETLLSKTELVRNG